MEQETGRTFVYVIGARIGPQKIGIAKNPERRRAALQTGTAFQLVVHHTVQVSVHDSYSIERRAHGLLSPRHCRGEWFDVPPTEALTAIRAAVRAAQLAEPRSISGAAETARKGRVSEDGLLLLYRRGHLTEGQYASARRYREHWTVATARGHWSDHQVFRNSSGDALEARGWLTCADEVTRRAHGDEVAALMVKVVGEERTVSSMYSGRKLIEMRGRLASALSDISSLSVADIERNAAA